MKDKKVLSHRQRKLTKKQFPRKGNQWHAFGPKDYAALPKGEVADGN